MLDVVGVLNKFNEGLTCLFVRGVMCFYLVSRDVIPGSSGSYEMSVATCPLRLATVDDALHV